MFGKQLGFAGIVSVTNTFESLTSSSPFRGAIVIDSSTVSTSADASPANVLILQTTGSTSEMSSLSNNARSQKLLLAPESKSA